MARIALPSLLLATLLAACGQGQQPADADSPGSRPSGTGTGTGTDDSAPASQGGRIDTGLASFDSGTGAVPDVRQVIRNRTQLAAFAKRFGAAGVKINERADATDFSRFTLVGWSVTTGCAKWPSATLHRSGDTLRLVAGEHQPPPPECFAPFHAVAVFTVPSQRMPEQPRFAH